jgi:hypothetical protein
MIPTLKFKVEFHILQIQNLSIKTKVIGLTKINLIHRIKENYTARTKLNQKVKGLKKIIPVPSA